LLAVAATLARWLIVGRVLAIGIRDMARPFVVVMLPAVATMIAGSILLAALSGFEPLAALTLVVVVVLAVDLVLLRVVAAGIVRDALSVLPVPASHARRVGRWLGLAPAEG
jgi:hypothetical protein